MQAQDVLHFWFQEVTEKQRFAKNDALDATLSKRFGATLQAAVRGELSDWRATAAGSLAEIVVLDQFSRNLYRDTPAAFAQDPQALTLAQVLVASGQDQMLDTVQRSFAYMPYMHSESLWVHAQALPLFTQPGLENTLAFEQRHQIIIAQFSRYPHRNAILGRQSTTEELTFLALPGSSF
ncbi:MAG: hypothetical protein ACI9I0_002037 [Rhodoferax sp.]|jgi:uncharacterized protein (DUF924 family)